MLFHREPHNTQATNAVETENAEHTGAFTLVTLTYLVVAAMAVFIGALALSML